VTFTTRFAPSPTGPLHLGHAYSALLASDMAAHAGGRFLLRIEDIDHSRVRPGWEAQIYRDLAWLGLSWEIPVMRQSERLGTYHNALKSLWDRGLLFPCTCTRRDIKAAASTPQEGVAPPMGPDGPVYPGTCRPDTPGGPWPPPPGAALRLDMARAVSTLDGPLTWQETGAGPSGKTGALVLDPQPLILECGDVVLARRGMGTSYHLAVTVDDAAQGISHVIRGRDLFAVTPIQLLLQHLLGLPQPVYHHHRLIRDVAGKRLAKRDNARAIRLYRDEGRTPGDIRRMVGL